MSRPTRAHRRTRLFAVLGVAAVLLGSAPAPAWSQAPLPTASESEPPAEDEGGPCDVSFGPADWICDRTVDGIGDVVAGGTEATLQAMVSFVVDGAVWLLERLAGLIDESTRPEVTAGWFQGAYRQMSAVAVFGLLPFLLLAVVQAVLRQDGGALLRSVSYVAVAALGTGAAVAVVDMLVTVTDALSAWIGRSLGADLSDFAKNLGTAVLSLNSPARDAVASLAGFVGAGLVAFTAFAIWIELLLRQAAIYVAVLFLPLGFMALVWPATTHWLRRLVEGLVAIILSKFVIMAVMALAGTALNATGPGDSFSVVMSGGALLLLASLAPYVLLRLIPVFEAGMSSQLEGTLRRPTAAVSPHAGGQIAGMLRGRLGGGAAGVAAIGGLGGMSSFGGSGMASAEASGGTSGGLSKVNGTASLDDRSGEGERPVDRPGSGGTEGAVVTGAGAGTSSSDARTHGGAAPDGAQATGQGAKVAVGSLPPSAGHGDRPAGNDGGEPGGGRPVGANAGARPAEASQRTGLTRAVAEETHQADPSRSPSLRTSTEPEAVPAPERPRKPPTVPQQERGSDMAPPTHDGKA